MAIKLSYNNDYKEKEYSHTIEMFNEPYIGGGYGATKEEALEEFKIKFKKYLDELIELNNQLENGTAEIVEVDDLDNPI